MKRVMWLPILMILLAACGPVRSESPEWFTDFEAAQKASADRGVPILANFAGSDWCGWCIKLEKEVFSQKEFGAYAKNSLVLFLADFPSRKKQSAETKTQNKKLAEQYQIKGFPTVLLLNAKGAVIGRTGYQKGGTKKYIAHVKGLIGK